jgi:hypothetical protein
MHNAEHANTLERMPLSTPLRLSALWVSVTLCYLYGDYFGLYVPGKLQRMLDGRMGPLGAVTQRVLLGTAVMMAIPALMVVLSLVLAPRVSRWVNIVAAALFTAIMLLTMPGAWRFYQFLGVIEVTLTLAIIWTAWRWPRRAG